MTTIDFTITGTTPLIVNRFHEDSAAEATSHIHARKETPTPKEDAASRLYLLGDTDTPYFPAENLRQSIITAASRFKVGRRAATSDAAAALYIAPEALPLTGAWIVDARAVVIPATRGRIMRFRPMFKEWTISGTIKTDPSIIDDKFLRDIFDSAGKLVGIGDFRPARKGPYGCFAITTWSVL